MNYKTSYNEKIIDCTINFKKGLKNISLYIKSPGYVSISAPLNTDITIIQDFIERKKAWIYSKLLKYDTLNKLGTSNALYKLPPNCILFKIYSDKDIPTYDVFKASPYFKLCQKIVEDRCNHYSKILNVNINKVTLKAQKTRWGSASTKNNININWLLLLAPTDVLDYVIIHELSHLVEMNHSRNFWNIVKTLMPNYIEKSNWLKLNGSKLMNATIN